MRNRINSENLQPSQTGLHDRPVDRRFDLGAVIQINLVVLFAILIAGLAWAGTLQKSRYETESAILVEPAPTTKD